MGACMGLSLDEIEAPLDDIAFLSRSNHRIAVLTELAEGPRTRRKLREAVGVSRPTLGRVLAGFEERSWIARDGDVYAVTPIGRVLVEEFTDLMGTVEALQELGELAPRLPLEEMDFDLRRLADATITTPSPRDATAHVRREEALAEQAEEIRFFCNSAHPHMMRVYRDRIVEQGQRLEGVIAGDAMDAAADDPEMRDLLRDMIASDRTTIHRYDGTFPAMVGVLGETAVITPLGRSGLPLGMIETDDEVVFEWVEATIDAYKADAEEITVAAFGMAFTS